MPKNMETNTSFKNQLGMFLNKAEKELDELRLKIALGKMNGADLFEDMKKELRESFHEISGELKQEKDELAESVRSNIESLQLQLALGKAEALDAYEEQKKKIGTSIDALERQIRDARNRLSYDSRIRIQNELEKFRLKMEVLQIRYQLGKLELKDNVESKKLQFKKEFDHLLENLKDESSEMAEQYGSKLRNAYDALRKSLQD
jgi:hypothetical protein